MNYEDLKGIDVKKGLAIVANNKAVYMKLLKSFANNAFCEQILDAVKNGNLEQVRQCAHSLKGVAGNMYMDELFELSREIETAAKEGAPVAMSDECIVKISSAYERTLNSVNALIANPEILDSI